MLEREKHVKVHRVGRVVKLREVTKTQRQRSHRIVFSGRGTLATLAPGWKRRLQSIDYYSSNVVYCWPSLSYIVELPKVSELLLNAEIAFQYNWYCNLFSMCLMLGTHTTIIVLYFICVVSVSINTISTPVAKGQVRVCFCLTYHLKKSATVSNFRDMPAPLQWNVSPDLVKYLSRGGEISNIKTRISDMHARDRSFNC